MEIENADGDRVAILQKALIAPLRDRLSVAVERGEDLDVRGNIFDHEYSISDGRRTVAEVSKRWFCIADTYGVQITSGENEVLLLAVTAAVDAMTHDDR